MREKGNVRSSERCGWVWVLELCVCVKGGVGPDDAGSRQSVKPSLVYICVCACVSVPESVCECVVWVRLGGWEDKWAV